MTNLILILNSNSFSTPWCDASVYVLGGEAIDLLSVNRECFLEKSSMNAVEVVKMEQHTLETLRMGFESFLSRFSDFLYSNRNDNIYASINEYLMQSPAVAILFAIASYCLYQKSLEAHCDMEKNNAVVVINNQLAQKFHKIFQHLQEELKRSGYAYMMDVIYYNPDQRAIMESSDITVGDFFRCIDKVWFAFELPFFSNDLMERHTTTVQPISICEDLFAIVPVQLYWSNLFYISKTVSLNHETVKIPIPVYQYCSAMRNSFDLCEKDKALLYHASKQYGYYQSLLADKTKQECIEKSEAYQSLVALFGERHVFPVFPEYTILAMPFDSVSCPQKLENCGYVMYSPLTSKVFRDGLIDEIPKQWNGWLEKQYKAMKREVPNEVQQELKRKLIWHAFTGECLPLDFENLMGISFSKTFDAQSELYGFPQTTVDPYGLLRLIEYVMECENKRETWEMYQCAYIQFLMTYLNM